jgi:hypothetical protein
MPMKNQLQVLGDEWSLIGSQPLAKNEPSVKITDGKIFYFFKNKICWKNLHGKIQKPTIAFNCVCKLNFGI